MPGLFQSSGIKHHVLSPAGFIAAFLFLLCSFSPKPALAASGLKPPEASAVCSVAAYGADGSDRRDNTQTTQQAVDDCASQGGGTVLFPGPGTYLISRLTLKDNITLHLPVPCVFLRGAFC
ncbi:MAG: hypothetical protein JXA25_01870 [Anaerolineales bacterium]|nr:hypothetical protein [Anaerolineales bacterium]